MPTGMDLATDGYLKAGRTANTRPINPVTTRSGGNLRRGTYLNETVLTPEFVVKNPPKRLFSVSFQDDRRGMESQPLFMPNVPMRDGGVHNLMLSSTMSNHLYAHDAKTGVVQWVVRLGNPIVGTPQMDGWMINDNWGVLSTGVIIDNVWYVVAWISPDGTMAKSAHYLFAVQIESGLMVNACLRLTPPGGLARKQRASLTAVGRTLYIPWGPISETAPGEHGYITAVDTESWKIVDEINMTAKGAGAGIWMAGQGLSEYNGCLYALTGNGDWDGKANFGEAFIKLELIGGKLKVTKAWSPFLDTAREPYWRDMDLGSAGVIVIPELNLICGAGKDGILYVLDMATFQPKTDPIFYTYFPGFGVSAHPYDIKALDTNYNNRSHHLHSSSVYWQGKLWCWGENGNLRVGSIDKTGVWKFLARSSESASVYAPVPPGGMPGAFLALSANGDKTGVIWCAVPDGDANRTVTTGRIFAFDAQEFGPALPDGDISLKRVWMSDPHHSFNKFMPPVIDDGMIYMATYAGTVDVYG